MSTDSRLPGPPRWVCNVCRMPICAAVPPVAPSIRWSYSWKAPGGCESHPYQSVV